MKIRTVCINAPSEKRITRKREKDLKNVRKWPQKKLKTTQNDPQ